MNITDINSLENKKIMAQFLSLSTEHRKKILNLARKLCKEQQQKRLALLGNAKNDSLINYS